MSTAKPLVPPVDSVTAATLAESGVVVAPIEPLGATVRGLDLRKTPPTETLALLQEVMAHRGFLVFKDQGVLSGDEQVAASEMWGGRKIYSTHGVHPKAPNEHIFRLSNDERHGILGVGPQWHNDGSFERGVFSHVGYHIIRVPEKGGATIFAHQGAAFDMLSDNEKEVWRRRVSVNSNSGVLHPVVHEHHISGRPSVYLHLGMTGAIVEVDVNPAEGKGNLRLLEESEMKHFFNRYNDLLNAGIEGGYAVQYEYEAGDAVFIDNLAIAHRAAPEAHASVEQQGLRILHRTTVKAMVNFDPPFGLPPAVNIYGPNPFGKGVWISGGLGYRWDDHIRMQN